VATLARLGHASLSTQQMLSGWTAASRRKRLRVLKEQRKNTSGLLDEAKLHNHTNPLS